MSNAAKVQVSRRKDGKVTVTIKLIGWRPEHVTSTFDQVILGRANFAIKAVAGLVTNEVKKAFLTNRSQ